MPAFPTTRWSRVVAASDGDRDALNLLCTAYWAPLYAYSRRAGASAEEAQERVQDFLASFVARNDFSRVSEDRGRFRSYLQRAFKNHSAKRYARETAQKRGGVERALSWADVESQVQEQMGDTPEQAFERQWARQVVGRAQHVVASAYARRPDLLEALFPILLHGKTELSYAEIAVQLEMTEGAVKVAAHRLRRRFRDAVRMEVADTLDDPGELESELQHLMACLG